MDWVPEGKIAEQTNLLVFYKGLTNAFACGVAALLYTPVGPENIFIGYGLVSTISAVVWFCHADNPLGMETEEVMRFYLLIFLSVGLAAAFS